MKKTHAQTLEELESLRLTASNIEPQQDVSPDLIAQHEESLALIEDLKALLSQAKKEKEEALQQLTIRNEELASLKSAASKGADSKQQARYTQRITELEAELEKAKKHAAEVLEEGKVLAKKQLEIETKDRALKAKLRDRNEELNAVKKQLTDTSFRLEKTTETVMRLQQDLQSSSTVQNTNSKKLDDLERKYENLKQLHEEREKLYETQKAEAASVSTSLEQLSDEYEKAKNELTQLRTEQDISQNHIKQMEQLVAQSTDAFNQLQSEMNGRERELEITIQRLEEERRSLTEQLSRGEQAVSEKTMELVKELDKERRKRTELIQRINELKGEVKILRATNSSISSSQAQIESEAEQRLKEVELQVSKEESANSELRLQIETLQQTIAQMQSAQTEILNEKERVERQAKAEIQSLRVENEKQAETARHREVTQANEVQLAQAQFELVNTRYEETLKLVSLLKKQLQEKQSLAEGQKSSSENPEETPADGQGDVQENREKTAHERSLPDEEVVFPAPAVHPDSSHLRELEQQIRAKEGKIAALESSLERLRRDAECGANELMDLKMKIDEMEKREERWKHMEKELYDLQIMYNEMVDEYNLMKEEVMNVRDDRVGVVISIDSRICINSS